MELSNKKLPHYPFTSDSLPEPFNPQSNPSEISGIEARIEQLIEAAETQGLAIQQHPGLLNLLLRLDMCKTIPKEVEELMSEILIWFGELSYHLPNPSAPISKISNH